MKALLNFLHGNWLRHPLHALLVHLPMGLWPSALVFDVCSRAGLGGVGMAQASYYAILVGLIGAGLAALAGVADWSDVGREKPAWKLGLWHMILNVTGVVVWIINILMRSGSPQAGPVPTVGLALSALGTAILIAAAYLGGRMVYDHGTYVGWMAMGRWRRIAEAGGARVPEEKG